MANSSAYLSTETGRLELYVQPLREPGSRVRVSVAGARQPRWSAGGDELFFLEGSTLMAAKVSTESGFSVSGVEPLFSSKHFGPNDVNGYDVSADGRRFVLSEQVDEGRGALPIIRIVQNWHAALER